MRTTGPISRGWLDDEYSQANGKNPLFEISIFDMRRRQIARDVSDGPRPNRERQISLGSAPPTIFKNLSCTPGFIDDLAP